MKTIGTILIAVCILANVGIGYFLYRKAYIENPSAPLVSLEDLNKLPLQVREYPGYYIDFSIPGKYVSYGGQVTAGLIDYMVHREYKGSKDAAPASLFIYVTRDRSDINISTSEQYKDMSRIDFLNKDKKFLFSYIDGGILNKNGKKMYFDVIDSTVPETGIRIREKKITVFENDNLYEIIWQDDVDGFNTSVADFENMLDTLRFRQ